LSPHPQHAPFPSTTLFRSADSPRLLALLLDRERIGVALSEGVDPGDEALVPVGVVRQVHHYHAMLEDRPRGRVLARRELVRDLRDRKSTRLNSSHEWTSYS